MKNAPGVKEKFWHTKTNTAVYLIQLVEVQKQSIRADQKKSISNPKDHRLESTLQLEDLSGDKPAPKGQMVRY